MPPAVSTRVLARRLPMPLARLHRAGRAPLALLLLALAGCGTPQKMVTVTDAYVRLPAVRGNPAAAYFKIENGVIPDRLVSVTSPDASRAEIHASGMHAGMATMAPLPGVDIAAGATATFAPGANHVMLFGLPATLAPGKPVRLLVRFQSGFTVATDAPTIAAGQDAPYGPS
ncbi:copper chaperone PCu(A)C [Sphingomonas montana]|uniref:copper chaperone PCu(A)C n=1 Tax=Sphingomonas montana TaxID=1843236 RepID=UPI00101AD56C|nr:copper chaperone PCu(A)C [Sphingomonas montana]